MNDDAIVIERTPEFFKTAHAVSDFLKALPLSRPDNDKLIELMIRNVNEAEQGAFNQGFRMGAEFTERRLT